MKIEQRTVGDVVVLSVTGDITMNGTGAAQVADAVRSQLHAGRGRIVLDLGSVRYVDSVGLGELVEACAAARYRRGDVKLLNVTKRFSDLLVVTRLVTVFDCYERVQDAVASFDQPATSAPGRPA